MHYFGAALLQQAGYQNLAAMTASLGMCLYRIKPKLHMQVHLVSLVGHLNPFFDFGEWLTKHLHNSPA